MAIFAIGSRAWEKYNSFFLMCAVSASPNIVPAAKSPMPPNILLASTGCHGASKSSTWIVKPSSCFDFALVLFCIVFTLLVDLFVDTNIPDQYLKIEPAILRDLDASNDSNLQIVCMYGLISHKRALRRLN